MPRLSIQLSSAFAENGGYSLWVQAAFGDFWGLQESYWSWFSGVVDSALYPVLLYSSTLELLHATQPLHNHTTPPVLIKSHTNHSRGSPHHCVDHDDDGYPTSGLLWCLSSSPSCASEYVIKLLILLLFMSPNMVSPRLVCAPRYGLG